MAQLRLHLRLRTCRPALGAIEGAEGALCSVDTRAVEMTHFVTTWGPGMRIDAWPAMGLVLIAREGHNVGW